MTLSKAKAMYSYQPEHPDDLGFEVGDLISVLEQTGDWWKGELNGKQGFVPFVSFLFIYTD